MYAELYQMAYELPLEDKLFLQSKAHWKSLGIKQVLEKQHPYYDWRS